MVPENMFGAIFGYFAIIFLLKMAQNGPKSHFLLMVSGD